MTQTGMRQHFEYGNFLRNRYGSFLSKIYDRNRVSVRSTDYDRTLMSASSLLAGLFKPYEHQVWNKDIAWQPIPVHTTDANNDNVHPHFKHEAFFSLLFNSSFFEDFLQPKLSEISRIKNKSHEFRRV